MNDGREGEKQKMVGGRKKERRREGGRGGRQGEEGGREKGRMDSRSPLRTF